jgi:hypothetical protein
MREREGRHVAALSIEKGIRAMVKKLALAFAAVFLLSAVVASAAQAAEGFNWESGTTKLTGSAKEKQVFTTVVGSVECNEVTGEAIVSGTGAASVTTSKITYTNNGSTLCPFVFGEAEIKMNGCNYRFNAGSTFETNPDKLKGTADITCPKGVSIEIVTPFVCTIKIPGQTGLAPVYYEATTANIPKDLDINPQITNISYSYSGSFCGTGSNTNGTYTGKVTVTGEDSALNRTAVWVE